MSNSVQELREELVGLESQISAVRSKLVELECEPNLGHATTHQLFEELKARFEIHCDGGLDYRTVDGD